MTDKNLEKLSSDESVSVYSRRSSIYHEEPLVELSKYKLNYKFEEVISEKDRCYSRFYSPQSVIPASVDMRPLWGEIFDQGELGSCTSNSIAGQIRYVLYKSNGPQLHPSRLFIYYNGRILSGYPPDEDTGLSIKDACMSVNKYGVCDESHWPYRIHKFAHKPPEECYLDALKHNHFAYYRVPQSLNILKQVISQKYMVSFGAKLYESFMSNEVSRTGVVSLPRSDEVYVGSHAMCLVGYSDKTKMFAVANSWSDKWGCNGFCYIPYDYIVNPNLCSDFWTIKYYNEF